MSERVHAVDAFTEKCGKFTDRYLWTTLDFAEAGYSFVRLNFE